MQELETEHDEAGRRTLEDPEVLTVKEAADKLRVSRWMAYQLIRSRKLPTFKIGRRRYVLAAAIRELIMRLSAEELL